MKASNNQKDIEFIKRKIVFEKGWFVPSIHEKYTIN
jgi:hypothetical protein